jgi:hypothetical protein
VTTLVRPDNPDDELASLHARVKELEAALDARTADLDSFKLELEAFRIRYRKEVGLLHDQLDELEIAIAELELGELSRKVAEAKAAEEAGEAPPADTGPSPVVDVPPRFTSDAVRKLFREVAKIIHPDLAHDGHARDHRHSLMVQANRAYRLGDEEQLRWILQMWERSPEAVRGSDPDAMRLRMLRRMSQLEEHLDRLSKEREELLASPIGSLKVMVDEAAGKGKDLIAQMVRQLQRDIMAATNRLDAMRY